MKVIPLPLLLCVLSAGLIGSSFIRFPGGYISSSASFGLGYSHFSPRCSFTPVTNCQEREVEFPRKVCHRTLHKREASEEAEDEAEYIQIEGEEGKEEGETEQEKSEKLLLLGLHPLPITYHHHATFCENVVQVKTVQECTRTVKSNCVSTRKFSHIPGHGSLFPGHHRGIRIGALSELAHSVSGTLWAPSPNTILIQGFTYDGKGPDAFFIIGLSGTQPDDTQDTEDFGVQDSTILSYPYDGNSYDFDSEEPKVISRAFHYEDVLLHLPEGVALGDIAWFAVYCRQYSHNFGSLNFREDLDFTIFDVETI